MRFRLVSLAPVLETAIAERLAGAGHEPAADRADALVAGLGRPRDPIAVLELGESEWTAMTARMRSVLVCMRDFAADLLERGAAGRVVVVVDASTLRVAGGAAVTAVAGAFLTTVAQVAAAELGGREIAVNVLAAGGTTLAVPNTIGAIPLGRPAEPAEIAAACEFLLSDQASYITGATLAVDGGYAITKAGASGAVHDRRAT
jgi:NAD(P)-dependent dehydrogenase (short-subunit alcohol dehydrogenase family)